MKILFVLNDGFNKYIEYQATGTLNAPNRRVVEIKLTPEQVKQIGIRKFGISNNKEITESIESISLLT